MSTRTDALVSQQETGKLTASIIPIVAGCHPARGIKTSHRGYVPTGTTSFDTYQLTRDHDRETEIVIAPSLELIADFLKQ
jgi:hypothetical protein